MPGFCEAVTKYLSLKHNFQESDWFTGSGGSTIFQSRKVFFHEIFLQKRSLVTQICCRQLKALSLFWDTFNSRCVIDVVFKVGTLNSDPQNILNFIFSKSICSYAYTIKTFEFFHSMQFFPFIFAKGSSLNFTPNVKWI